MRMMPLGRTLLNSLLLMIILTSGTFGASSRIRLAYSSSIEPAITELLEAYKNDNKKARIKIKAQTMSKNLKNLSKKRLDVIILAGDLTKNDRRTSSSENFRETVVAKGAYAPTISSYLYVNGVESLSLDDLKGLYSGSVKNWMGVGGPDFEVHLIDINPEEILGIRESFIQLVFGNPSETLSGAKQTLNSENEVKQAILDSHGSIGLVPISHTTKKARAVALRKKSGVVYPTYESVRDGHYPFTRNITVVTNGVPTEKVNHLIDFIREKKGWEILKKYQFVTVY